MEIKTKFNVGDKVWYVAYDHLSYDCPICDEETYDVKPCAVQQGDIEEIEVIHNIARHSETYKIIAKRYESGICAYTNRKADGVYATKEQAEKAYAEELAEYYEDKRIEKQHLIEWVNLHYEENPTED